MKDLVLHYNSKRKTIDSYDFEEFKNILEDKSDTIVSRESQGLLFLSDGGIIKCVKNYYLDKDSSPIPRGKSSDTCFSILNEFGLHNVGRYDCHKCHLKFIDLLENNEIKLKSSKKA